MSSRNPNHHRKKKGKNPNRNNRSGPPKQHTGGPPPPPQIPSYLLASFYNDARINILACLNELADRFGGAPGSNDSAIINVFNSLRIKSRPVDERSDLDRALRARFRYLDVMADPKNQGTNRKVKEFEPQPRHVYSWLLTSFQLVTGLRNSLVHPFGSPFMVNGQQHRFLVNDLGKIYDASLREVKKRFGTPDDLVEDNRRHGDGGRLKSRHGFDLAFSPAYNVRDKNYPKKYTDILYDFGHVVFCSLFLEKGQSAELLNRIWQTPFGQRLSQDQKKMLGEVVAYYRMRPHLAPLQSDHSGPALVLDTLSELARAPRMLLDRLSEEDRAQFRVEVEQLDDSIDTTEGSLLLARSNTDRFPLLMQRFLDIESGTGVRFGVNLGRLFNDVRIKPATEFDDEDARIRRTGVTLLGYGRPADFVQSESSDVWQTLIENANQVQRCAAAPEFAVVDPENESREQNYLNSHHTITPLKPYLVRSEPRYQLYDDKVGFRIKQPDGPLLDLPDLSTVEPELAAKAQVPSGNSMEPDYWVGSTHLLSMMFCHYLLQASSDEAPALDSIIQVYRGKLSGFFNQVRRGEHDFETPADSEQRRSEIQQMIDAHFVDGRSNIPSYGPLVKLTDLPKVFQRTLMGAKALDPAKYIPSRLARFVDETRKRQNDLATARMYLNKRGQKRFKPIKCGHIAEFLSRDLLRFQPVLEQDDGGKINSQQFQILQASLAFYSSHIDRPPKLVDLFSRAGLYDNARAHPFLVELDLQSQPDRFKGILQFYDAYLDARLKYLLDIQNRLEGGEQPFTQTPKWLQGSQISSVETFFDDLDHLPARRNEGQPPRKRDRPKPVPIPGTLFRSHIIALVAEAVAEPGESWQDAATRLVEEGTSCFGEGDDRRRIEPSVTWFLKCYVLHQQEQTQSYYSKSRSSDLFNFTHDHRKGKFQSKPTIYFNQEQRQTCLQEVRDKVRRQDVDSLGPQFSGKKPAPGKDEPNKLDRIKRLINQYRRGEARLKQYELQDMLLYLYAKKHLSSLQFTDNNTAALQLADIDTSILSRAVEYQLAVPGTDRVVVNRSCEIRRISEFRALMRDRRLPSLVVLFPGREPIDIEAIRKELISYRSKRISTMEQIHRLEEALDKVQISGMGVPDDEVAYFGTGHHGKLLYQLFLQGQDSQADTSVFERERFNRARLIRNAFSHSEYPSASEYSDLGDAVLSGSLEEPIADWLYRQYASTTESWIEYLQGYQTASATH